MAAADVPGAYRRGRAEPTAVAEAPTAGPSRAEAPATVAAAAKIAENDRICLTKNPFRFVFLTNLFNEKLFSFRFFNEKKLYVFRRVVTMLPFYSIFCGEVY